MTSTWGRFRLLAPHLYLIAGASLGGLLFLRHVSSSLRADKFRTVLSPRETILLQLSDEEVKKLPYPPNALPGSRDVDSPYGSIRVYEWGPEDGEKILLIHGISTPSIALTDLAHQLVGKGCRVILFGRETSLIVTDAWFSRAVTVCSCSDGPSTILFLLGFISLLNVQMQTQLTQVLADHHQTSFHVVTPPALLPTHTATTPLSTPHKYTSVSSPPLYTGQHSASSAIH